MTKQVLFVQGGGAGVHDTWDDKPVRSLERELGEEYALIYPRMPDEANPSYPAWKTALLNELARLDVGVIFVRRAVTLINHKKSFSRTKEQRVLCSSWRHRSVHRCHVLRRAKSLGITVTVR
jgi:hypothetical protein